MTEPRAEDIRTEAEWRVRGACELGINPYQPGRETDFRDDVRMVLVELNDCRAALHRAMIMADDLASDLLDWYSHDYDGDLVEEPPDQCGGARRTKALLEEHERWRGYR